MKASLIKIARGTRTAAVFTGFVLMLLLLIVPSQTCAQEQDAQPARQAGTQPQGGSGNNLMQQLNLTPEQRAQLREIRNQDEPETRALTRRMRLARRALEEAIYSDASNEELIQQRTHELSDAQAALVQHRAATELKVRRILTNEQLQSFRNLRQEAQRRQQMQRRQRRNGQQPQSGVLDQSPAGANTPADSTREPRPLNTPRARQRRRLDRP
ncbi:MAG: periplasmic protein CpxP/Spy [Acidobacteriota bacterium]|jgi:Spy/CpxP family protein refolding chaperone|nr:periplasmic protein CpxP/Spy [Acidobacteriota bacterium]MDT7781148.1 periplasmic protein CpxP/Spy [Acidobacteriota bacterium]